MKYIKWCIEVRHYLIEISEFDIRLKSSFYSSNFEIPLDEIVPGSESKNIQING